MITAGQVTSGGSTPLEALPGAYRAIADWLPFRYVTDGWGLGAYLIAAAAAGGANSLAQDRLAASRKDAPAPNLTAENRAPEAAKPA